uniref:AP complex mu/sigma subunit domain-containing protein n=1 Tax=Anas zonorhyncha TaxID=75864 RepID=A0A8B9V439_9AVES
MRFMLLFSRQGKLRLQKWFLATAEREKRKLVRELMQLVLARKPKMCSFLEWRDLKVVYKRYASLYFCCAIEGQDNELITLELIHRYVELLDKYFGSVSPPKKPQKTPKNPTQPRGGLPTPPRVRLGGSETPQRQPGGSETPKTHLGGSGTPQILFGVKGTPQMLFRVLQETPRPNFRGAQGPHRPILGGSGTLQSYLGGSGTPQILFGVKGTPQMLFRVLQETPRPISGGLRDPIDPF